VIDAESAHVISHTAGAFILLAIAVLLLASALAWYKYAPRYQEWIRSKRPSPLRPLFKSRSSQQWFGMKFNRNFGAIFLFLAAAWAFILGIGRLIT